MKKTIASLCVILVVLGAAAWLKRTDIILAFAKYQSEQRYADVGPTREISWQQGPTAAAESMSERPPNIILIVADDLGYKDVGYKGCTDIPTPHIDALAKSGVQFSNGYSAYSVCGPSRAGFITGRYQQRFGSEYNPQYRPEDPNMGVPKSEKTIAEVLKPLGLSLIHI